MSHEVRLYTICLEDEGALEVQEALNLATPEEAAEAFFDEALRRGEGEWDDKKMQLPQDAKFIGATKSGSGNIYHCADTYFLASIETTKLNEAQLKKLVMESVVRVLKEETNMDTPKFDNVDNDQIPADGNYADVLVPEHCLNYLVNGDLTGYEDDEIEAMQRFESKWAGRIANGLIIGDICVPLDGRYPSFEPKNDVYGWLGCDCYRFMVPLKGSEEDTVNNNEPVKLSESQLKHLVMESVKKVLRESVQNVNFQNAVQEVMSNPVAYGLDQLPLKTKVRKGMKGDVVYADFVEKKHFQNMKENEEGWVVRLGGRYYVLHIYWNVGSPMVSGDDGLSLVVKDFISFQSEQPVSGFDRLGTAEMLKRLIARKASKMTTEIEPNNR